MDAPRAEVHVALVRSCGIHTQWMDPDTGCIAPTVVVVVGFFVKTAEKVADLSGDMYVMAVM